jgi:sigma-B regulation protein RsbU (phosphoserine phosphatase)
MRLIPLELESKLRDVGLWPHGRIAWAALYVLVLDLLLFAVQWVLQRVNPVAAESLEGWIIFLSALAIVLFTVVGFGWLRSKLLWRLRNRLIVTYVFIGVIPVFLLLVISLTTLYLLAGQFASFVVTSDIATHLHSMEAANRAIAHRLGAEIASSGKVDAESLSRARPNRPEWSRRQVCSWYGNPPQRYCSRDEHLSGFDSLSSLTGDFREIVRDHSALFLRTGTTVETPHGPLRVVLSEPLDKDFVAKVAGDLGLVVVYDQSARSIVPDRQDVPQTNLPLSGPAQAREQSFSYGTIPAPANSFDREVRFPIPLQVVDWGTGARQRAGALAEVGTRPSVLYARLFAALGDYARGVEYILLSIAIVFAIIELFALFIGTKLTRSITYAVAQLYEATKHINRADFSHRITVQSSDQLATLANSFNSMTMSIEALVQEQKEKQRLEGELAIAQEVQAQLYPKLISQLDTLEVHGFCLPARTVSGDYYDFLALNPDKLMLAVGDISGKGISAALMMATINSAVRAYSMEDVAVLRESVSIAGSHGSGLLLASESRGADVSPATLLTLLNHQLYANTPAAKYATLFLGIYDGATRRMTYSNGGHLPPILISEDGSSQLLSCGGTVIGLFDNLNFPEATVRLRPGDLMVAYSDGITEPENDYGEFGEERLIQLVRANRHLPLERITEIVTAAVHDWIGDIEQPDDITLVLARAR